MHPIVGHLVTSSAVPHSVLSIQAALLSHRYLLNQLVLRWSRWFLSFWKLTFNTCHHINEPHPGLVSHIAISYTYAHERGVAIK